MKHVLSEVDEFNKVTRAHAERQTEQQAEIGIFTVKRPRRAKPCSDCLIQASGQQLALQISDLVQLLGHCFVQGLVLSLEIVNLLL